MARGKLKYRDVVGGRSKKSKKFDKKKAKPRKTYSLYHQDTKKPGNKRKFENNDEDFEKRKKNEEEVQPEEESSESEEEEVDAMKELRSTFASTVQNKKSLAIDSSDESSEEEQENSEAEVNTSDRKEHLESGNEEEVLPDNDNLDSEDEQEIATNTENEEIDDNMNDPFIKHISYELHENLLKSLQNVPVLINDSELHWPNLGRVLIQIPQYEEVKEDEKITFSIEEKKKFAPPGTIPSKITGLDLKNPENLFIKTQIINNLSKANRSLRDDDTLFTDFQSELFSVINNYQDLYYCQRSFSNCEEIRFVYCLHAVNHILKTRLKVVHHNARLSKKDDVPEDFRDQGLARPKVCIM